MTSIELIREYLMLFRIRYCAYIALLPVTGALAMGMTHTIHLTILFIIGSLYHLWGFVMNDYYDCEIDRKSPFVFNRPLAKGTISKTAALFFTVTFLFLYFLLVGLFFLNTRTLLMAIAAPFFSNIYNIAGKKFIGSDIFLAIGILCVCLLGAFSVDVDLTPAALFIALIWALEWLYFNPMAGLKDLEFDRKSGVKTLPVFLGITTKDNRFKITWSFKLIISFIKLCQIVLIGSLLMSPQLKESYFQSPLLLSLIFIVYGIIIFLHIRFFSPKEVDVKYYPKVAARHTVLGCLGIFLLLVPLIGYAISISLYFFFFFWLISFNLLTYGKIKTLFPPKEKPT